VIHVVDHKTADTNVVVNVVISTITYDMLTTCASQNQPCTIYYYIDKLFVNVKGNDITKLMKRVCIIDFNCKRGKEK